MASSYRKYMDIGNDSDTSTADERKRRRSHEEEQFQRSKKTIRTPTKQPKDYSKRDNKDLDLREMMREMMQDIKKIKKGQDEYQEEIRELKETNKYLIERVNILEKKVEKMEKERKKNNIVVRGTECNKEMAKQEICAVLQKIGVMNIEVKKTETIIPKKGKPLIVAELGDWEEKSRVMKQKNKLKGSNVYIDNDYTETERKVQNKLVEIAKDIRKEGKQARVGYRKLIIEGKQWVWNSITEKLEEQKYNEQEQRGPGIEHLVEHGPKN